MPVESSTNHDPKTTLNQYVSLLQMLSKVFQKIFVKKIKLIIEQRKIIIRRSRQTRYHQHILIVFNEINVVAKR